MISVLVEQALKEEIEEIEDVIVHIDPEDDEKAPPTMGLPQRTQMETLLRERWRLLDIEINGESVTLHYLHGKMEINLHVDADSRIAGDRDNTLAYMREQLVDQNYISRVSLLVRSRT